MVLKREVIKKIEYHFYNYEKEKKQVEEIASDIAEASSYALDLSGVHGTDTSDPTARQAELIEKNCRELRSWIKVVEAALKYFEGINHYNFIIEYYGKKQSVSVVSEKLFVSKESVYKYREDVINYAIVKANEYKLICL